MYWGGGIPYYYMMKTMTVDLFSKGITTLIFAISNGKHSDKIAVSRERMQFEGRSLDCSPER